MVSLPLACFIPKYWSLCMYKLTVTESHLQYLWTLQQLHRKIMAFKVRQGNQYYSVKNSAIVGIIFPQSKEAIEICFVLDPQYRMNCLGQFIYLLSQVCMGTLRKLRQIN